LVLPSGQVRNLTISGESAMEDITTPNKLKDIRNITNNTKSIAYDY
jgi:hypothetical protein